MRGVKGLPWAGARSFWSPIIARRIRAASVGAAGFVHGADAFRILSPGGDGLYQKDLASWAGTFSSR